LYNDSFAEGIFISSLKDKWDCFFVSCYIVLKNLLACRCEFEVSEWVSMVCACTYFPLPWLHFVPQLNVGQFTILESGMSTL